MERLIRFVPVGTFSIYLIRCLLIGPQLVDAAILGIITTLLAYSQFKTEEKSITELKNELITVKKEQEEMKKHHEELRSHMSSMKMGMNMRSNALNGKPNI